MNRLCEALITAVPKSEAARRLGRRIWTVRRSTHWSQRVTAKQVGVSQPTVARWEAGDVVPPFHHLLRVAAALSVSPHFLIFGEEDAGGSALDLHTLLAEMAEQFGEGAGRHLEKEALTTWPPQMQTLVVRLLEFSHSPTTANLERIAEELRVPLALSLSAGLAIAHRLEQTGGLSALEFERSAGLLDEIPYLLRRRGRA